MNDTERKLFFFTRPYACFGEKARSYQVLHTYWHLYFYEDKEAHFVFMKWWIVWQQEEEASSIVIVYWRDKIVTAGVKNVYKGMEFRDRWTIASAWPEHVLCDHGHIPVFRRRVCLTLAKQCISRYIKGVPLSNTKRETTVWNTHNGMDRWHCQTWYSSEIGLFHLLKWIWQDSFCCWFACMDMINVCCRIGWMDVWSISWMWWSPSFSFQQGWLYNAYF